MNTKMLLGIEVPQQKMNIGRQDSRQACKTLLAGYSAFQVTGKYVINLVTAGLGWAV